MFHQDTLMVTLAIWLLLAIGMDGNHFPVQTNTVVVKKNCTCTLDLCSYTYYIRTCAQSAQIL